MSLYLNFCSLSSTKPLLASVWRSNFCSESQNHMLAMHIINISNFFKISRSSEDEKQKDESGQEEDGVEIEQVDGKR